MITHVLYWLLITLIVVACATGGNLRFQDRELLIHPDKPGLGYPYKKRVCKDSWLGERCKEIQTDDFYDLNDVVVRQNLINAGFTCKSSMRFKY